jgi:predicted MFS family arabinose efflux permease
MTSPPKPSADRDFAKLWFAQTISALGARITRDGLPMAAVLTLRATPFEVGVLAALSYGPALLVGLACGGFVDRTCRRRLMIWLDLLRAAALATIPVASGLHLLSMPHLYLAAGLVGAASVLFDLADHAYLPGLVSPEQVTAANARLSSTDSAAEVVGPALAGVLFQWLAGPLAVAFNAATYLASAAFLARIRKPEPPLQPVEPAGWHRDIADGWRAAATDRRVAPLLFMTGANALFGSIFGALYVIFALRILGLTPSMLGFTIGAGGVGGIAGAVLAPRFADRVGMGRAIVMSAGAAAVLNLLIPAAPKSPGLGMGFLTTAQLFGDAFAVAAAVLASSQRQIVLPQAMLGRVGATFHAVGGAMAVCGAFAGGILGGVIGIRSALYVAALGLLLGPVVAAAYGLARKEKA